MDWTHKFLVSTVFTEVDEALFTAIQGFDRSWLDCDKCVLDYVNVMIYKVKDCKHLHIKKYLWLTLMLVSPSMQKYVCDSCSKGVHYANWWIKYTKDSFEQMLTGNFSSITELMTDVTQSYVTGEFITKYDIRET